MQPHHGAAHRLADHHVGFGIAVVVKALVAGGAFRWAEEGAGVDGHDLTQVRVLLGIAHVHLCLEDGGSGAAGLPALAAVEAVVVLLTGISADYFRLGAFFPLGCGVLVTGVDPGGAFVVDVFKTLGARREEVPTQRAVALAVTTASRRPYSESGSGLQRRKNLLALDYSHALGQLGGIFLQAGDEDDKLTPLTCDL